MRRRLGCGEGRAARWYRGGGCRNRSREASRRVGDEVVLADAQVGIGTFLVVPVTVGKQFDAIFDAEKVVWLTRTPAGEHAAGIGAEAWPGEYVFSGGVIVGEPDRKRGGEVFGEEIIFAVVPGTGGMATVDDGTADGRATVEIGEGRGKVDHGKALVVVPQGARDVHAWDRWKRTGLN